MGKDNGQMTILYAILFLLPISLTLLKGLPFIPEIIRDSYYIHILLFSLKQALLSTVLSLLVGFPGAFILAKRNFKGKKLTETIYKLPFVLPSILTVLGFVIFYGNSGFLSKLAGKNLNILYSFKAVLLAHVFYNFPVIVSIVSTSWKTLDQNSEDAARTDGASESSIFLRITLPRLKSSILSACALVFLYCYSSFAIILVLGGSPDLTTAEVEIFRLGRILLDTNKASALAIVSCVLASLMLFFYRKLQLNNENTEYGNIVQTKPKHKVLCTLYVILSLVFVLSPVCSIIVRSFFSSSTRTSKAVFTLRSYLDIPFSTIALSTVIGICSSVLSVLMAIAFCRRKIKSDFIILLPLATSSVILGLGYFTLSKHLGFVNPILLTVCVHSIINTGFAYKTIEPSFAKIPNEITDQARTDGAKERTIIVKVQVPIVKKSIITALMFCFVLSCGELNSTLLLGNGNIQTIPVAIYRMIGSYNFQGACAAGTILIILCSATFYLGNKLQDKN